jgi:hypothetical protein
MQGTAIVTGGTRGLGRAISLALRDQGYRVAATYHSNDVSAHSFQAEIGIPIFKWDVADFEACRVGTAAVMQELGSIEVLVNNAGITADATLKNHQSWFRFQYVPERYRAYAIYPIRSDRKYHFGQRAKGASRSGQLLRIESWHHGVYQGACARGGTKWYHGKLRRSGVLFNGDGGYGAGGHSK